MSRKRFILSAIFVLSIFFVINGNASYASADEKDNRICKGVFIDEVDVSGMTKEEAQSAVASFVEGLKGKGVAITVGEDVVYTTLGDLGYTVEENDDLDQALALGKSGNLIKRYKDLKDIEQGSVVYPLTFSMGDTKLKDLIAVEVGAYNIAPVNAKLTRKHGDFIYTDHVVGRKVDVDQTAKVIMDMITNNWNRTDIVVDAVLEDDMPQYTKEMVEQCNTILGTYSTEYTSSAEGRAANLANGAKLINNAVIYPGETFSGYVYLNPFTPENGYYEAGAYLEGKIIDSIGGGACQVTTTLYNAVLNSELEVVQRNEHSMTISYVDLSRDAAIAGTTKDFKFKNNTDAPILIEAYTVDRKITFNIWGHETRDMANRRVEYITKVLSETAPPADVITKDPTQPTTYKKVDQSAHTGYKAQLYKVVYENDVEISRTLINSSTYGAAPAYITVGTKVVKEEIKKPTKPTIIPTIPNDTETNPPVEEPTDPTNPVTEGNSITPKNQVNPESQLQADIWDPAWDAQGLEDE